MSITTLQIKNFRNLSEVAIQPLPKGLNVIYGQNGSGKTSLLEAIYYLCLGKSFRTTRVQPVIQHGASQFSLFSEIISSTKHRIPVGIERNAAGKFQLRINRETIPSLATLAFYSPIRLIHAEIHQLLEGGPIFRRKFIDWGLFYQSQQFLTCWRRYLRALKQRNSALYQSSNDFLSLWTEELIKSSIALSEWREQYLLSFTPLFKKNIELFLNCRQIELIYFPGWDSSHSYQEILSSSLALDYKFRRTHYGAHRADFTIKINERPAKDILSRGQQKLLICAMMVTQGQLLTQETQQSLIYLIDDLPAELDTESRRLLIQLFCEQNRQVFMTTIEKETISIPTGFKLFHVEHGQVIEDNSGAP
jgi:DNA replication and repair protein RecF